VVGDVCAYRNGTLLGCGQDDGFNTSILTGTVARDYVFSGANSLNGTVEEVRQWSTVRTTAELAAAVAPAVCPYVFMIFRPALRFFTGPRPPRAFAARFFAAVILPPLLFFTILR
jgi:hypothetical protein